MKKISELNVQIQKFIGKMTSLLLLPLIVVVVYTAIMRYLFASATDWGFEVSVFMFGAYSIFSGAYVLLEKGHVRVDILPSILGEKGNRIINVLSSVITISVSAVLVYMGSLSAIESTKILERSLHQSTFNPPIWWFRWLIPIAALLILIQAVVDLINDLRKAGSEE